MYGCKSGNFTENAIAGHNLHDAGVYLKSHWSVLEFQTVKCHQAEWLHASWAVCYVAGRWEYPSPVDPSQFPSESRADFAPSEMLRSSSSDSSKSTSSSAAERRDSTEFGTLMESVCGSWHSPAKEGHAEAAVEAEAGSTHSTSSLPEPHSSTAAAKLGGAPSTAVATADDQGTTAAAGSDAVSAMTAGSDASAATAAATDSEGAHHDTGATAGVDTGDGAITGDTSCASHLHGSLPPNAQESSLASENAASEPEDAMALATAVAGHDRSASSADSCATPADGQQASDPGGSASVDSKQAESPICRANGEVETTAAPDVSSGQAELSSKAAEPPSQVVETASKSPTTPPKSPKGGSPKKGGLVNVQRPAVKGYSIHRQALCM